jgi:PAS domain S-box-containing protein
MKIVTNTKITSQNTGSEDGIIPHKQLLEMLPAAVYTCDANGFITFYNKAAAIMWGREPEIGKDLWCGSWRIYHPDGSSMPLDECPMAIALKEGRPVMGHEIIVERPDGSRYTIQPHPQPYFDASGKLAGAVNMLVDISEQKTIQAEIRQSEERFRLLADFVPQIIWTADANGHLDYYNKKWYEYTGFQEGYGDESWMPLLHPDDVTRCYDTWYRSVRTGEPYFIEYRFKDRHHPNMYRWFLGRALPVRDNSNKIVKWFGTCTDIHEQKTSNERKDEFIGIASHELKTPLTSVKAYVQLLESILKENSDENVNTYIRKANMHINRLDNLIRDLLDVSKVQSGKLSLQVSRFDFDDFATECIENCRLGTKTHKIIMEGAANAAIEGDKFRLEQVFTNYISNAIKYSPKSDKVLVRISSNSEEVTVAISDLGIGIAKDKISHLFQRFYRVEDHAYRFQGLGLGLYISSEIIKRHNGKVWAESEEGKGSTFCFSLPVALVQE